MASNVQATLRTVQVRRRPGHSRDPSTAPAAHRTPALPQPLRTLPRRKPAIPHHTVRTVQVRGCHLVQVSCPGPLHTPRALPQPLPRPQHLQRRKPVALQHPPAVRTLPHNNDTQGTAGHAASTPQITFSPFTPSPPSRRTLPSGLYCGSSRQVLPARWRAPRHWPGCRLRRCHRGRVPTWWSSSRC